LIGKQIFIEPISQSGSKLLKSQLEVVTYFSFCKNQAPFFRGAMDMTENLTVRTERKLVCLRAEDNYLREGVAKKQMSESSRPLISRQKKKKVFGYTAYFFPTK